MSSTLPLRIKRLKTLRSFNETVPNRNLRLGKLGVRKENSTFDNRHILFAIGSGLYWRFYFLVVFFYKRLPFSSFAQ